jgi:hypothetical protein
VQQFKPGVVNNALTGLQGREWRRDDGRRG